MFLTNMNGNSFSDRVWFFLPLHLFFQMGKASACSVSLLWVSCQYPLRLECISNPGGCIWHKVSCSFLPVALVKKPGAALAGWSRRCVRSLSCLCTLSWALLQGKNPVCFDVSCFLNVPVPLYFCPEKLQFNSLANQQMSFVFSHGIFAALVLVRPKPRGLHLQGKSSQVTLMSFLGTRRFDLFLSL